ncbi:MAG: hypothetical protein HYR55_00655 [Acidobacteria bacterium]|nr:hypothetical protein [Acidobacteriota bacterium]MBI3657298.1 hypothetical protein [Acidobacteriota bacterium]
MKRNVFLVIGLMTVVMLGGQVWAQMGRGMSFPKIFGDWNATVGSGASYLMETEGKNKPSKFDIAVVGEEKVDGQSGYWFEMNFEGGREGQATMKYLFIKSAADVTIKRMVMKAGDQPAMEMPMEFMGSMASGAIQKDTFNWKNKSKLIGSETVSTPAGSFTCDHYQTNDKGETHDVWISSKVAPYGLVKTKSAKMTMTLQKVLTGQKSKITETPRKMDIPFGKAK